jgi:hypothetical protein
MTIKMRYLSILVAVLGIASLLIGAAFIGLAIQKNNYVVDSLRAQKVTVGLTKDQIAQGQVVDNAQSAQAAADTLAQHLKSIAPSYGDLMAANKTGKYDPTNPTNLTYTQGLNMENSFNLVVLSFGVIQETMVTGAVLIIIGIAVGAIGLVLFKLTKKVPETIK